jgi:hypothetical protein
MRIPHWQRVWEAAEDVHKMAIHVIKGQRQGQEWNRRSLTATLNSSPYTIGANTTTFATSVYNYSLICFLMYSLTLSSE